MAEGNFLKVASYDSDFRGITNNAGTGAKRINKMSLQTEHKCEIAPHNSQRALASCQLGSFGRIEQKNTWHNNILQYRVNIFWPAKRKAFLLKNRLRNLLGLKLTIREKHHTANSDIRPGDIVKVLEITEIKSLLEDINNNKRCIFLDEMYKFCGKEYVVLKEVEYFFDEVKNKMCRCNNIYMLKGVTCSGSKRLYSVKCDRNCFFFWHKDWLIKLT